MSEHVNYLLGYGERLTSEVRKVRGGDTKDPAYSFNTAVERLTPKITQASSEFDSLPKAACPDDQAVAIVTLHPRYLSKSDQPSKVLESVGLRAIGSKSTRVKPENWGIKEHPVEAPSTNLFVAGTRQAFKDWSHSISEWKENSTTKQLTYFETVEAFSEKDRIRRLPDSEHDIRLELVLHTDHSDSVLQAFEAYAHETGAFLDIDRRKSIGGLCFMPATAERDQIETLAKFTFLRVVRGMPSLRPMTIPVLRTNWQSPKI